MLGVVLHCWPVESFLQCLHDCVFSSMSKFFMSGVTDLASCLDISYDFQRRLGVVTLEHNTSLNKKLASFLNKATDLLFLLEVGWRLKRAEECVDLFEYLILERTGEVDVCGMNDSMGELDMCLLRQGRAEQRYAV